MVGAARHAGRNLKFQELPGKRGGKYSPIVSDVPDRPRGSVVLQLPA
jgi:hypothetical protein